MLPKRFSVCFVSTRFLSKNKQQIKEQLQRWSEMSGGLSTFNIQHGFVEALVRGYRSGFLKDSDYHHLTQCESLEVC
jgi:hypothetical protein